MHDIDYEKLDARVESQVRRVSTGLRTVLLILSILLAIATVLLAGLGVSSYYRMDAVMLVLMIGSFGQVFLHVIGLLIERSGLLETVRARMTVQELERYEAYKALRAAKAKRALDADEDYVELSDDGEWVPVEREQKRR
ncbi:MAG TPA: hypothetical protein PKX07_22860 [Aggregatilineales bacterium]|jgi:hypothetical protein|nr:hypothetical protein [Aggregatilineales bacterium]